MISAQEARKKTDEYNMNRAKIVRVLCKINEQIEKACNMGISCIFVEQTQFKDLTCEQTNSLISELKEYEYNVTPKLESHKNIAINCQTGYEISW